MKAAGREEKIAEKVFDHRIFTVTNDTIKYFEDDEEVSLVVSRDISVDVLNSRKIFELDRLAQIGKVTSAVTHELKESFSCNQIQHVLPGQALSGQGAGISFLKRIR